MLNKKTPISASIALILSLSANFALAATHVQVIDAETYQGKEGTITFDDWGFVGPNGRTAVDFEPVNGFGGPAEGNALDPTGGIGQIQHVVTRDADGLTPDAPVTTVGDLYGFPTYGGGSMDATVSFYHWAYTTKGGSVFSNMFIDKDGDYFIAQKDMSFLLYNSYTHNGTLATDDPDYYADGTYATRIAFQPYVLSDAKGWCGSILASNPGALQPMAGQVSFDFAFDVYFQSETAPGSGIFTYNYSSTEIVKDFQMRSYGEITVDIDNPPEITSDPQYMNASAVVNNTNPGIGNVLVDGAPVDPAYYNLVSFMGAGVLDSQNRCGILNPDFVGGIGLTSTDNFKYTGLIDGVADEAECNAAGGTWQGHAYGGYAYILRADGIRVIEAMDYAAYPDLTDVPTVVGGVAFNNDEFSASKPIADITGTPAEFSFVDQTDVALDTQVTSNVVTMTDLARDTVITVSGGEYSINGGAYTSARGAVVDNDLVQLRTTSSGSSNMTVDVTLTVGSVSDTFSVTTAAAPDTTPDLFSFTDQTNLGLNKLVVSDPITVTGINTTTSISVTGGEYNINGSGYTSIPGSVDNGDVVTVRHTTAPTDQTTVNTNLDIGGVVDTFSSTTQVDTTPDAFSFVDQINVALESVINSNSITVAGINMPSSIAITGGEYSINGGEFTSAAGSVSNGDTVVVRIESSVYGKYSVSATLDIGGISDTFIVTTDWDTIPNQFSFYDRTGAQLNTLYNSTNSIQVSGVNNNAPISVTGGEYSIDGGAWTSASGTVNVLSRVLLRQTSASTGSTQTDTVLTIGGVSATFSVTTKVTDTTPNSFSYYDRIDAQLGYLYNSTNSIQVSGITGDAPISVTGGEYSIDGGAWTSAPGTVSNLSRVLLRQTSASTGSTQTDTVLTIGGVSATFSITTKAAPAPDTTPNQFSYYDRTGAQLNYLYNSTNSIQVSGIT
ncbi:MAG: hypothetical protein OQK69_02625, partial [Gammaproteobacteria bacterium]|nr:hypothetical protein [Gammaproteobacteria bacterium]